MKKALLHVILPIIAAIIVNAVIYTQGWNNQNEASNLLPPGYAIAIIWIFILGLLGYTHYLVYPSYASFFIIVVILYCLAYPFLTSGLQANKGDVYNILAFVLAILVSMSVYTRNQKAVLYTLPFFVWTAYVAILTLLQHTTDPSKIRI